MEILLPHLFVSFLIVSLVFLKEVSAIDPLSEALLSFKSEITDDSNSLKDWFLPSGVMNSDKVYACSWTGVKCNQNSSMVIGLDLSVKNLGGALSGKQFYHFVDLVELNLSHNGFSEQLPVGIFDLTSLVSLDISRNNFSGHFPSGIANLKQLVVLDAFSNSFSGPLPADVSELESLKVLNFAGSYFSGPIPSEYGSFKSLEFIHLAGNFLNGSIPPELGKLKTVTHMEIGYNIYEGGIPWQLGNMSELQYLDIAGANLSGPIPTNLSNLTKLESLFLFRNLLNGMIPWEFSKLMALKSLDLSDNLLFGTIPESLSELKNLRLLSLMYNDLSGTVPDSIAELPELDTLLIWSNFLSGSLPQNLGRYSKMKHVDVSTNNFNGGIPPGICAGGMLAKLILFSNNFTGSLHPSLSNCSSMVRLRLEDNSFSGEISVNFSNNPDLSYVDLSRNSFTGGIPREIYQASKLQYFNVSNNPKLGGSIPQTTWSLPLLQNFSATNCGLIGTIPPFEHCESVSVIELGDNNLTGNVPGSLSSCQSLVITDLADNNLTGHIPEEIASLPALTVLDLSHNSLSGPIPARLGSCSSLKVLNVSFNDISGTIPPEKTFRTMESSAFFGNPKLCGAPLRPCHLGNGIPNGLELGSKRTQKHAWILIICGIIVLIVTTAAFGILYFRRGRNQWKMVSFSGLPRFTANDILRSFNDVKAIEAVPISPDLVCKAVLPTGITVSVKKIDLEPKRMNVVLELLGKMGNARHKNLTRLLGYCYNKDLAYLLYDYLPNGNLAEKLRVKRDWETKCKIVLGIARGLCFLHHDCYPAIPHGDLNASNILFDENMEPHLVEYGLKSLVELNCNLQPGNLGKESGEFDRAIKDELHMDIIKFGEVMLEILSNGKLTNAEVRNKNMPKDVLIREISHENDLGPSNSFWEQIELVVEVAFLCISTKQSERPSMQDVLKLLSGLKTQRK